jgi:hypothetical protein
LLPKLAGRRRQSLPIGDFCQARAVFRYPAARAWAIDRLGRSLIDLLGTIQHLEGPTILEGCRMGGRSWMGIKSRVDPNRPNDLPSALPAVSLLLSAGADLEAVDAGGMTAPHCAATSDYNMPIIAQPTVRRSMHPTASDARRWTTRSNTGWNECLPT